MKIVFNRSPAYGRPINSADKRGIGVLCRCTKRRRARKRTRIRDLTAWQGALSGYRVRAGQGRTETECRDVGRTREQPGYKKAQHKRYLASFLAKLGREAIGVLTAEAQKRFPPFTSHQRHVAWHRFIIPITRSTLILNLFIK